MLKSQWISDTSWPRRWYHTANHQQANGGKGAHLGQEPWEHLALPYKIYSREKPMMPNGEHAMGMGRPNA
jgi:hypothetical protein